MLIAQLCRNTVTDNSSIRTIIIREIPRFLIGIYPFYFMLPYKQR
jgi:uncharacterized membrane protein